MKCFNFLGFAVVMVVAGLAGLDLGTDTNGIKLRATSRQRVPLRAFGVAGKSRKRPENTQYRVGQPDVVTVAICSPYRLT